MKALLYSNTVKDDYTCQLPEILACANSSDDLCMNEQFSDSLSLLMGNKWDRCTFHIWGKGERLEKIEGADISFAEVVETFFQGETHELSVDVPDDSPNGYYTENWSVRGADGWERRYSEAEVMGAITRDITKVDLFCYIFGLVDFLLAIANGVLSDGAIGVIYFLLAMGTIFYMKFRK